MNIKLTPYKLARIKSHLPDEDKQLIDAGNWSSELTPKIHKMAHLLAPKRLSQTKGAFGKPGTNRKEQKRLAMVQKLNDIVENQKDGRENNPDPS